MNHNLHFGVFLMLASIYGAAEGQVVPVNPCEKGIDLGIIVERSKIVGTENFITMKEALIIITDNLNITAGLTHASLIDCAGEADLKFNLSDSRYQSNQAVINGIYSLPDKPFPETRTDLALMKAHDELFTPGNDRRGRPNVLVVITAGNTASQSAPYSETVPPLEDQGVNIIAVGIGSGIATEELHKIAGRRGSVVQVKDFVALAGKLNHIFAKVCIINGGYTSWSLWSQCSVTCGAGIRTRVRNCTNPEPMGGGKNCDDIGPAEEQEDCNLPDCEQSVDGGYTRWTCWSRCSVTCGKGYRIRYRSCTNPPPNAGGKSCDHIGVPQETKECSKRNCKTKRAPCDQGLDLGILIDRSLSIRKWNLERLLKVFMPKFLNLFKITKRKTNIGVVKYDKDAELFAPFNGPKSRRKWRAISYVKNLHPGVYLQTRTDKGLITSYNQLFTRKLGDRRRRQNVLVTFTDGRAWPQRRIKPFSETVPPLRERKKCHMVAVGYGVRSKLNASQLQEIADDNVILVPRPARIARMAWEVKKAVCEVDGGYSQWSTWTLCSATCGLGVKVRNRVCNSPPPRKGGKDCSRLGDGFQTAECNEAECPTEPSPCIHHKLDVGLIVDASSSVGVSNFVRVKTFLVQFIHQFEPRDTHFSIMTFNRRPTLHCKLNDSECQSTDGAHDLVAEIPDRIGRGTHTDKALILANTTVYTAENGDRPDATNVLVVITDGRTRRGSVPFSVTIPPLREGKGTKILAFGVGPKIREADLNEIAGEKNWFYVSEFTEMKDRLFDILDVACNNTAVL